MKRVVCFLFLATVLNACTSPGGGPLEKGATAIPADESVFILGVSPVRYRVVIASGSIKAHDGWFYRHPSASAVFMGAPDGGFVVARVRAGDVLALTSVTAVDDKNVATRRFEACGGIRSIVFNAPSSGGKVLYLGDVDYQMAGDKLSPRYTSNIDAAKRYMDSNYPAFKGRMEQWSYKVHPVGELCLQPTTTIYVPIPKY